jgi:hypothetical protein
MTITTVSKRAALYRCTTLHMQHYPKRLEAARAATESWKSYSHACQARHNVHRLRLGHR